jgi:hypothetical protein
MAPLGHECSCDTRVVIHDCCWGWVSVSLIPDAQTSAVIMAHPFMCRNGHFGCCHTVSTQQEPQKAFLAPPSGPNGPCDARVVIHDCCWGWVSVSLVKHEPLPAETVTGNVRYYFGRDFKIMFSKFWVCRFWAYDPRFLKTLSPHSQIKNSLNCGPPKPWYSMVPMVPNGA